MKKYVSKSIEETQKIAHEWVGEILSVRNSAIIQDKNNVGDNKNTGAFIVGLSGHLGAGKTAFVKCVAKELGIKQDITSPTYVIMKIYDIDYDFLVKNFSLNGSAGILWRKLVHIDAYRLEKPEELQAIDWESIVEDKDNLIMIEWPENVDIVEEELSQKISFDIQDDVRVIGIE
jgi:tRNA threonylcarbamoyladenosine biosynthesis protein TsaE